VIARDDRGGLKVAWPIVDAVRQEIRDKQIDVLVIDPFVASHGVPENDNGKINEVCRIWKMLADETGCAVELVHHTRKSAFGQAEYSVDDARGAGSLINAVRSARTLNLMTKDEAGKVGIGEERRLSFFRVDNGKANHAPPAERSTWRRHISVQLGNGEGIAHAGDSVGVVTPWEWARPA
jgi:RecA-family ATPase